MTYFSERETGEVPRTATEVPDTAWRGIARLIQARIEDGSFGAQYPENCPDGAGPCGTDWRKFWESMFAEVPNLAVRERPLDDDQLPILDLMDMIEFCWQAVGKPESWQFHSFFQHDHLNFDIDAGRAEFRERINRIFRRNSLAYDLSETGQIKRLAPEGLHEALIHAVFQTGDPDLDTLLESARQKFLDPDEMVRREALEKLWDAWERVKTIEPGPDKRTQAATLIHRAAGSSGPSFRQTLETEAREVTNIGNSFQIRHSETTQEPLTSSDHVDWLFHRLFSLIRLVLRTTSRGG